MKTKDREAQISRARFATLMYRILELCYPDLTERSYMLGRPAKYLFGVNLTQKEKHEISQSISGRMNQSNRVLTVAGRELSNYCNEYRDKSTKDMVLGQTHYRQYLDFAFQNEAELDRLNQDLAARFGAAFPPADIRRLSFPPESVSFGPQALKSPKKSAFEEHIHAFTRSNWFFYFYEYKSPRPSLIRLVMKFEQLDNVWLVQIVNPDEKYATYKGEIVEMTARRLRIELSGEEGKTMNFMAHIEPSGESEMYMGMFMKNSGGLVSCSVILHRIPDAVHHPKAGIFFFDDPEMDELVPRPIRDFFEKKEYVYTKVTRLYSLDGLDFWLKQKRLARKEDIVRHVFLTAPVGAYHDQNAIVNLPKQEEAAAFPNIAQEAESFKKDVFDFQDAMEKKFFITSYFALRNEEYYYRSPKTNLQTEWDELCRSRALLIIVPARPLFSSCWVILGWAMARKMPIFLLCHGEGGLPDMVRFADYYPNIEKINFLSSGRYQWHHSLADAPEALGNNAKWRELVRKAIPSAAVPPDFFRAVGGDTGSDQK